MKQPPVREFEPSPFQKEVFERIASQPRLTLERLTRPRFSGYDPGIKSGDKTVVTTVVTRGNKPLLFILDEFQSLPDYKWYKNPFKWLEWHKIMKKMKESIR